MISQQPSITPSTSLTRRRVVGAAAWSAPAITLAGAAPAFAASGVQQLRVNIVEQKWRDVLDEYVVLKLSVTNLSKTNNAGALSLKFTFATPWTRANPAYIWSVNINPGGGGTTNWGPNWARTQSTRHFGTGTARSADTIFTLASLPKDTTSGELYITMNSTNPSIYGDATPLPIGATTIPTGFTMAPTSAKFIIPTT